MHEKHQSKSLNNFVFKPEFKLSFIFSFLLSALCMLFGIYNFIISKATSFHLIFSLIIFMFGLFLIYLISINVPRVIELGQSMKLKRFFLPSRTIAYAQIRDITEETIFLDKGIIRIVNYNNYNILIEKLRIKLDTSGISDQYIDGRGTVFAKTQVKAFSISAIILILLIPLLFYLNPSPPSDAYMFIYMVILLFVYPLVKMRERKKLKR